MGAAMAAQRREYESRIETLQNSLGAGWHSYGTFVLEDSSDDVHNFLRESSDDHPNPNHHGFRMDGISFHRSNGIVDKLVLYFYRASARTLLWEWHYLFSIKGIICSPSMTEI